MTGRKTVPWLAVLLAGCSAARPPDVPTPMAGMGVADAAILGGMPELALNVTRSILDANPRDVAALVRQGIALSRLNQPEAAAEAFRRALAVNPDARDALLGLGRLELARGEARSAEAHLTTLLARAPDDVTALNDFAVALDLQGRHGEAQAVYARALRLAPDNRAASVNLALSLSLSGQPGTPVEQPRGPAASQRESRDLSAGDAAQAVTAYQVLDATKK
jgi:Flp pilus assembly protein TadD